MRWLLATYTSRFNRRHKVFGHLFSGRYKALVVDGEDPGYLKNVCDYVHLNPVVAGLVAREERLTKYSWSSYVEYLKPASKRPGWLRVDRLFGEHGIRKDSWSGRKEFERCVEYRRRAMKEDEWKGMERGWCRGSETFQEKLLKRMGDKDEVEHYGEAVQEMAEQKAKRILEEELKRIGWTAKELKQK